MFINNVTGDANFTEGFGSIFSFKIISYALSQIYNIKFVDNPLKNVVGNEFMKTSNEEYDELLNNFFKLNFKDVSDSTAEPFDIIFNYTNKPKLSNFQNTINNMKLDFIYKSFARNLDTIYKKNIISDLSDSIPDKSNQKYYKEGLNIVIHLRAPLREIDIRFESSRNYFYGSYKDIDKLNNFIRQIEHSEKNNKLNFHILTLGTYNLDKVTTIFPENKIFIHNNLDIFESFSMMVHNDGFVAGQSNLSYIAHLLSKKRTIFHQNLSFGSKAVYHNVLMLNNEGMLDKLSSSSSFVDIINELK